jgi:predicted nucleic acid-binding protein
MKRIVLDASVMLSWLLDEARPPWVDDLIETTDHHGTVLTVPSLFWLEVGSRLASDRVMSDEQAMDGLLRIESLGIETIELDRPLRLLALQLARATRLTVYDAAYIALAGSLSSPLATLDQALGTAAATRGLGHPGKGVQLAEDPARYGSKSDVVSLAAIGVGLADLRKRYATLTWHPTVSDVMDRTRSGAAATSSRLPASQIIAHRDPDDR